MTGPLSMIALTASQPPISAATSGISQTSCIERPDFGAAIASGKFAEVQSAADFQPSFFSSGSQIRRGSNAIAANIVSTTTAPNAMAPGPGWMVASAFNCTSATITATT